MKKAVRTNIEFSSDDSLDDSDHSMNSSMEVPNAPTKEKGTILILFYHLILFSKC